MIASDSQSGTFYQIHKCSLQSTYGPMTATYGNDKDFNMTRKRLLDKSLAQHYSTDGQLKHCNN